ncbi:MAG TPA: hypothetical protein PK609_01650 [Candidatus Paceibacterota bacterium]|nr:hypothetical protein [Candidatus Paceibacterota bacterium]
MNDFKKNYKPGGFKQQGGFSRPSFGGGNRSGGRSFGGPSESFKTNCSKCNDVCEVPFRPNGKKPVFCKNCFVRDDARDSRDSRPFEKRSFGPERSFSPKPQPAAEDPRIGAMQRELTVIHEKLDTLIQSLESSAYSSILTASNERAEKPAKEVKKEKAAPKAKAAPKKKVAKKK